MIHEDQEETQRTAPWLSTMPTPTALLGHFRVTDRGTSYLLVQVREFEIVRH